MALAGTTILECRTDGSDNNGGGYNPSRSANGIDRSQQASSHVFIDGSTITATVHTTTTQIAIVGYTVGNADLGNLLNITGGTSTSGVYEITAVDTTNNRWTLDRSAGTSTQTVIGRMGGAFASPGYVGFVLTSYGVTGMTVWFRGGTYAISTNAANVSGGTIALTTAINLYVSGYGTTRGDSERPIFQNTAATSLPIFNTTTNRWTQIRNIIVDGGNLSNVTGFQGGSRDTVSFCKAINCPLYGFYLQIYPICCEADTCGQGFSTMYSAHACVAKNCTNNGFHLLNFASDCIAHNNGASGFDINTTAGSDGALRCISVANASHGFNTSTSGQRFIDCVATDNGGHGFRNSHVFYNCFGYNNTSGNVSGSIIFGSITTLSASPWQNSATKDYRRNSVSGAGLLLKEAATAIPPGQINTRDASAIQTAAPSRSVSPFNQEVIG